MNRPAEAELRLTRLASALDSTYVIQKPAGSRDRCPARRRVKKPSLFVVWLTVFIDLVGFGIIVPSVPGLCRHFGASGFLIGVIFASFSATQFIFAPVWGRLSDRIGRRPVLLMSTCGAAISYVLYALGAGLENHAAALWLMTASRAFAGVCGGNIVVAQAYIADTTPPEQRSKGMGLIGMAFGLGFIFGPIIGGVSLRYWGGSGPGWVAAAICAANFLLAWFILVESRKPGSEPVVRRPHLDQWLHTLRTPKIGLLVIVFYLSTFCYSSFESTLPLLISDSFHLDLRSDEASATTVMYLFAYCAIIGAFIQGGAIGRLVKRLGEPKLIALSLVITAISFMALPFIKGTAQLSWGVLFRSEGLTWVMMHAALAALSIGTSLTRPPLFGLLSNLTHESEQGANIGVAQGAGSLARIVGPIFATTALDRAPALPYLVCAAVLLVTAVIFVRQMPTKPAA